MHMLSVVLQHLAGWNIFALAIQYNQYNQYNHFNQYNIYNHNTEPV